LWAYGALEFLSAHRRQYEEAVSSGERAVQVAPGCADAYLYLGRALSYASRDKEALGHLEKAVRMNPYPPSFYYMHIGMAHFNLRQHEQAVRALQATLNISPRNQAARRCLIVTYVEMGRMEKARLAKEEMLKMEPSYNSKGVERKLGFKDPEVGQRWAEALRKMGLERDVSTN
jgi:adenylate cyclase